MGVNEALACNVAIVAGVLSSDPAMRELASGDIVMTYEVTTRVGTETASSVPVAWFCQEATKRPDLHKGDAVVVTGRVHRRFFRTGGVTQSRTEVVADRVVPGGRRKAAAGAIGRAIASVPLE
ncbi:MAG: single-stranded DNA-binding protein [Actinobacteria bacterium]|nr:single-stranded DNA-binding protein [Actinomycetota bacterium]